MDHEPRIRVSWSPRTERPWCPGATRPSTSDLGAGPTGWTSFFKKGVVGRLKRRADPLSTVPAALPKRSDGREALQDSPLQDSSLELAAEQAREQPVERGAEQAAD